MCERGWLFQGVKGRLADLCTWPSVVTFAPSFPKWHRRCSRCCAPCEGARAGSSGAVGTFPSGSLSRLREKGLVRFPSSPC